VWRSEADEGGKSGSQSGRKGCVVRRFVLLQPFINGRAQRVLADERRHCPLPLTSQAAAPHTTPFAIPNFSTPPFTILLYGTMAPSLMASDAGALKDWTVNSLRVSGWARRVRGRV